MRMKRKEPEVAIQIQNIRRYTENAETYEENGQTENMRMQKIRLSKLHTYTHIQAFSNYKFLQAIFKVTFCVT